MEAFHLLEVEEFPAVVAAIHGRTLHDTDEGEKYREKHYDAKPDQICMKVKEALIEASTTYKENQKAAYYKAVCSETIPRAKWALEK